jgi:hypothetical protein
LHCLRSDSTLSLTSTRLRRKRSVIIIILHSRLTIAGVLIQLSNCVKPWLIVNQRRANDTVLTRGKTFANLNMKLMPTAKLRVFQPASYRPEYKI